MSGRQRIGAILLVGVCLVALAVEVSHLRTAASTVSPTTTTITWSPGGVETFNYHVSVHVNHSHRPELVWLGILALVAMGLIVTPRRR